MAATRYYTGKGGFFPQQHRTKNSPFPDIFTMIWSVLSAVCTLPQIGNGYFRKSFRLTGRKAIVSERALRAPFRPAGYFRPRDFPGDLRINLPLFSIIKKKLRTKNKETSISSAAYV